MRKTRYRLRGDRDYEAVLVRGKETDGCGQVPYRFVTGPWQGEVVYVEPRKMWKVARYESKK